MKMNIPQILPPNIDNSAKSYQNSKIALIGCGPASISCATFLARLGYKNLTVYEKEKYIGGLSSAEIPQYRLPIEVVQYEVSYAMHIMQLSVWMLDVLITYNYAIHVIL